MFYGGLVPFALTDPVPSVDEDGGGTLRADLSGCASSIANPSECTPLAPEADVTVATFSGVEVDPGGAVSITPDYAGVEVELPAGTTPQQRTGPGWGGWPQPFVDFHVKTGLAAYWYTSGSAFDPDKAPAPFLVDFLGESPPAVPPAGGTGSPQQPAALPAQPGPRSPERKPIVAAKLAILDGARRASLLTLSCPAGGRACKLSAPKRVAVKIDGASYRLRVIAPRQVEPGGEATLMVRLSKAALEALGRGTTRVRVRIVFRLPDGLVERTAKVKIAAAG
ncbi:MAG: hypothetical protein ACOYD4_09485 [Solirubrobacterales bacterium]